MAEFAAFALALWIVTHTVATEIPFIASKPKPLSCQLCLSGWFSIGAGVIAALADVSLERLLYWLSVWASAVLLEAAYNRLNTYVL